MYQIQGVTPEVPAVLCVALASEGGTYDDEAFMAGWFSASVDFGLYGTSHTQPGCWQRAAQVPIALCPQMALIAARNGCVMKYLSDMSGIDPVMLDETPGTRWVVFDYHDHEVAPIADENGHSIG